ncbi:hypothetical protein [Arthrobacter sp. JCM 19049]|uniref:hypothetical protein n=1 Tax=Arthrobacter sp. JCM 19049 TaxID=1460643 RepID=UPI002795784A|nr:hypothetical protein [Arthrobacter sp. JCM 19049]
MKESFGSDGQPGSYRDIDACDALFLFGHNMAETQTVLWPGCWTGWPGRTNPGWCAWILGTPTSPGTPRCTWR